MARNHARTPGERRGSIRDGDNPRYPAWPTEPGTWLLKPYSREWELEGLTLADLLEARLARGRLKRRANLTDTSVSAADGIA